MRPDVDSEEKGLPLPSRGAEPLQPVPPAPATLRQMLRHATDASHQRLHLDPAMRDLFAGNLDVAAYARLLRRSLALHEPIERALERHDSSPLFAWRLAWPPPRRAALLRADLVALGQAATAPALPVPRFDTAAAALGCAWVVEGSALGARLIWRRLQDQPHLAAASGFFAADPDQPRRWAACCDALESGAADAAFRAEALAGAQATFAAFEAGLNGS